MTSEPTTIFDVHFPYDAKVVFSRGRRVNEMSYLGRASVSVRHVELTAFVPAVRVIGSRVSYGHHDILPETLLHGFEGALWTPLINSRTNDPLGMTIDEFIPCVAGLDRAVMRSGNPFHLTGKRIRVLDPVFTPWIQTPHTEVPTAPMRPEDIRSVEATGEPKGAADAQRVANSLLVVDGRVWQRTYDPFWSAKRENATVELVLGPEDEERLAWHPEDDPVETFRADRLGELREWREKVSDKFPSLHYSLVGPVSGQVEVLDGSFFSRDDLKYFTRGFARLADKSFRFLKAATADELVHWTNLRDLGDKLERNWSREDAISALDSLSGMRKAINADDLEPGQSAYNDAHAIKRFARATVHRALWFESWVSPRKKTLNETEDASIEDLARALP